MYVMSAVYTCAMFACYTYVLEVLHIISTVKLFVCIHIQIYTCIFVYCICKNLWFVFLFVCVCLLPLPPPPTYTKDYGIWERGDKTNNGEPELNASSIGMAKVSATLGSRVGMQ